MATKTKKAQKVAAKKPMKKAAKPVKKAAKPAKKSAAKKAAKPAKLVRKLISSGSIWEPKLGYSRAVRLGNTIYVSGTTGGDATDVYGQTKQAIQKILDAVAPEGARAQHVVRTRIYMTDIKQWEEVARAHGEVFGDIRPATALVQVPALIDPNLLVEIEADFVIA